MSEVGLRTLGTLTPVDIAVSGFRLTPVVAASPVAPRFRAADGEVERVVVLPLGVLADPAAFRWASVRRPGGEALRVPAFHAGGVVIWGATGMVLAEFLTLLGWRAPALDAPG